VAEPHHCNSASQDIPDSRPHTLHVSGYSSAHGIIGVTKVPARATRLTSSGQAQGDRDATAMKALLHKITDQLCHHPGQHVWSIELPVRSYQLYLPDVLGLRRMWCRSASAVCFPPPQSLRLRGFALTFGCRSGLLPTHQRPYNNRHRSASVSLPRPTCRTGCICTVNTHNNLGSGPDTTGREICCFGEGRKAAKHETWQQ
jgi:hypothetical protein